jgi:hypothetical protein
MTRSITDILWTGSARVRAWRGGDVRKVYYTVLAVVVSGESSRSSWRRPVVLLQIGANIAGVVFIIAALHLLYLNTRLLPPSCGRRCGAGWRSSAWSSSTGSS